MDRGGSIPAVFLDRDGTIIEDRGNLRHPAEVVFFPETVPALRLLQRDFRLFVVTHQPGVGEGCLRPAEVDEVHAYILDRLWRSGVRIERIYCCPHRRVDGCRCIKPNPYHLYKAARRYGLDLRRSFTAGDHPHDVELAVNAGATGVFLLTGHGARHRAEIPAGTAVAENIGEAAAFIAGERPST